MFAVLVHFILFRIFLYKRCTHAALFSDYQVTEAFFGIGSSHMAMSHSHYVYLSLIMNMLALNSMRKLRDKKSSAVARQNQNITHLAVQ